MSSWNTNVKSEINKLSTNKRCHFLEDIVPVNDSSEQNWNGYCNVDTEFTLDQTNASFICGIIVKRTVRIFSSRTNLTQSLSFHTAC